MTEMWVCLLIPLILPILYAAISFQMGNRLKVDCNVFQFYMNNSILHVLGVISRSFFFQL